MSSIETKVKRYLFFVCQGCGNHATETQAPECCGSEMQQRDLMAQRKAGGAG